MNWSRRSTRSGAAPDTTLVTDPRFATARSSSRIRARTGGANGRFVIFSAASTSTKPSKSVHDHQSRAGPEAASQHGVEAKDVEQRQHGQYDVISAENVEGCDIVHVAQQRAVAEHRGLWLTGRAGRVEQHCQRFWILR